VGGAEQALGGVLSRFGMVRGVGEGGGPLKGVAGVAGAVARRVGGIDAHVAGLTRTMVIARDIAAIFTGVDDVGIGGVGHGEAGLAATDTVPVAHADAVAAKAVARPRSVAAVLHRAGNMERHPP